MVPENNRHVLPAAEPRRLAQYIPRSQRPKYLRGRTRGEERYRLAVAPLGLTSMEDKLKIALCVEEEAILEDALMVDREALVEVPSEKSRIYRHLRQRRPRLRGHISGKCLNTLRR